MPKTDNRVGKKTNTYFMKKLLAKLESVGELSILSLDKSKATFGGSISYDDSLQNDSSTSYDTSNYVDHSNDHDS